MRKRLVVLLFYFLLGVIMEFPILALRLWLKESLEMNIAGIGVLLTTVSMPWTMKPLYGFLSDQVPLCGRRRKPYILLCNVIAASLWLVVALCPQTPRSVLALCFIIQTATCFGDVLYDATMVELSKTEGTEEAGGFQSWCWAARSTGAVVAAAGGGFASSAMNLTSVFKLQALFPLLLALLAAVYFVEPRDERDMPVVSGCSSIRRVFRALGDARLWKPALFVCVFAATPSSGTAWFYYLVNARGFTPNVMGMLSCLRHVAMLCGALAYRRFFRGSAFRPFFSTMVVLSSLLSLTPLILVQGLNLQWGIPDLFFVGGDDVFLATIGQIAMMPCLVLAAKLCPSGIEASLYASFIGFINASALLSEYSGAWITSLLGVTHDNFEAMPQLILICAGSSLLPLLFIGLLPTGNMGDISTVDSERLTPMHSEHELSIIMKTIGSSFDGIEEERRPCLSA